MKKYRIIFGMLLFLVLIAQLSVPFMAESLSEISTGLSNDTVFVTGNNANSLDLITRDKVSNSFKEIGVIGRNSIDIEAPTDKPLVVIGGPKINSITKELNDAFGILYEESVERISITVEGITLSKPRQSPGEDIGIIYFGNYGGNDVLLFWGASREGTFAAGLILEDLTNLERYGDSQFLLLRWKDTTGTSLVEEKDISITSQAPAIPVTDKVVREPDLVSVDIIVDFGEGYKKEWTNVKVPKDSTVFEAMRASGMIFDYSIQALGAFITSIEGLAESRSTGRYWQLWIDGGYAQLGVSNLKVTDGMKIEWRYTSSFFN